jgi:hypothetical protein
VWRDAHDHPGLNETHWRAGVRHSLVPTQMSLLRSKGSSLRQIASAAGALACAQVQPPSSGRPPVGAPGHRSRSTSGQEPIAPTAKDTTTKETSNAVVARRPISIFALLVRGMVSVGLKAEELVKET